MILYCQFQSVLLIFSQLIYIYIYINLYRFITFFFFLFTKLIFHFSQSVNVSRKVYDSIWYKQTLKMQKNLLKVLIFQRPVNLSIVCVLSELTLHYYCSVRQFNICQLLFMYQLIKNNKMIFQYLSNIFSIFAALRIILKDNI